MTVAAPRPDAGPAASAASPERLPALDLLRGAVMLLMAIDHVRVYAGVPPGGPTLGLFLTRWVTHFCAPVFVFLAGTSAYLGGRRFATRAALARFLVGRGLLLVLLELTVLRFFWTFTVDYGDYLLGGVIWAIGWSMVALGGLVLLPAPLVAAIGVLIMAGHNLLDPHRAALTGNLATASLGWLWQILYWGGELRIGEGGPRLVILYSLMPWIGVMAAGYGFGALLDGNPAARRRRGLTLGIGAIGVFLVLRGFNLYGDPRPWQADGPLPAALA
ncbi:MAG: heparan-alpha-glucosaminide N-acetyltransferase domain-containing protein, partial [Gemmatimonadales bacterium]|nr:heparan-alpha-glucosaminide N-acetyltransferase domain-containing protein [Gemmatimonadales bacterium]